MIERKSKLIKNNSRNTNTKENDKLEGLLKPKYKVFRASEDNVLGFFAQKIFDKISQNNFWCPLIDPRIIDKIGKIYLTGITIMSQISRTKF